MHGRADESVRGRSLMTRFEALRSEHLPRALPLLHSEGWLFSERDLVRLLQLPGGGIAAMESGELAGMLTVTLHGSLGWIGNVVVAPAFRGRGLAEGMVRHAMTRFREARSFRLCSVPKAVGLYAKLGFLQEGRVLTMTGSCTPREKPAGVAGVRDVAEVVAYDAASFGASRGSVLQRLASEFPDTFLVARGRAGVEGYIVARPGEGSADLGPWMASSPHAAARLLDAALSRLSGMEAELSAVADNPVAAGLARERGFEERFFTILMVRGPHALDVRSCHGLAGPEKG